MKKEYYLALFLIIFFGSCTKKIQTSGSDKYTMIADERFGDGEFDCSENQDMTFALCKHQISEEGAAIPSWDFFVFDKEKGKITYSESLNRGTVKWYSNSEVQVSKVPGTMAEGQTMDDYAWIIDIKSGTKTKKSEYRKQINN